MEKTSKDGTLSRKPIIAPNLTKSSFRMDRPWAPLLTEIGSSTRLRRDSEPLNLLMVGFATDKAKNIDVWERSCVVPPQAAVDGTSSIIASTIRTWDEQGGKLAARMKPNGSRSRGMEYIVATAAIRPQVESRVSGLIPDLLANPEQSWPRAVEAYEQMIAIASTALSPGFTTRAIERRNEIARTLPDFKPKRPPKPRKPKDRKGGEK